MSIKRVTYGQDTIIIGRGATETTAWALACEISERRGTWSNVYHRLHGMWHRVTCYQGRRMGHVYDAGDGWWSANMTVNERAAKLAAA